MALPHSPNSYDVAVVGSGPAGAITALTLAKEGVSVVILEKDPLPRYKTCGGGVAGRAIRSLPVDVSDAIERECHSAEMHFGPSHLLFTTKRDEAIISMTMRERFDFLLVSAAEKAGATVRQECRVSGLVTRPGRMELVTSGGPLFARFVVAADGAMGIIAKKAGWGETRRLIPAIECEVFVDEGLLERFSQAARFDFGPVPRGYGWVFPKKRHLSAGVLTRGPGPKKLDRLLGRYLKLKGLDKAAAVRKRGFFIPVAPRRDGFVRGRVILTGDAAGLADPLTGEGISSAILSGRIAAQSLLKGSFEEIAVKHAYETAISETLLPELRVGRVLAKLLYNYPKVMRSLFNQWGQVFAEAVTDVILGERTLRGALSNPMNYMGLFRALGRGDKRS